MGPMASSANWMRWSRHSGQGKLAEQKLRGKGCRQNERNGVEAERVECHRQRPGHAPLL